ncbi:hypothetical protein [Leptolyngbya sp. KIOST-1]|uniref:hypothetical protein n=1 Tax=Leptolyngbya sp. KIOST-1 TaxID=1229172 RepID=UPI00055F2063|nr:hypothetical protein [Leptolyngbya sp. KIOST-1]
MDLQSIQTKLIHRVNALDPSDTDVRVDWAGEPAPIGVSQPSKAGRRPRTDFSTAVETLQRRATTDPDRAGSGSPQSAEGYIQQLAAIANQINQRSAEQEQAIATMQTLYAHLAQVYPAVNPHGQAIAPPFLDVHQAAIASAEVDSWGNVVLASRPIPPASPYRGAPTHPIAGGRPRTRRSNRSILRGQSLWNSLASDIEALSHEPVQLVAQLFQTLGGLARDMVQRGIPHPATSHPTESPFHPAPPASGPSQRGASLSLVDSMLWFGGGVIGRLALNLLLGAFPSLWSLAVAAITAMTAYALYRATLAPKLAFGPALRVALLIVGLAIGGQL